MTVKKQAKPPQKGNRLALLRKNVLEANKLKDPLESLAALRNYKKGSAVYNFECKRVNDLEPSVLEWILNLEEKNMKDLYENCEWKWDFEKKKDEMTNHMAWYLIAKSSDGNGVGFSHFRFDMDYGSAVLYCYELQLQENVQRIGLGSCFMNILEQIAFANKMEKVVLTILKHNTNAEKFYTALNYQKDVTSPDEKKEKCCYYILSKSHSSNK